MENGYTFNSLEFITAGGPVSILVALLLLCMSVASWVVIISKVFQGLRTRKAFKQYVQTFWRAGNLSQSVQIATNAHNAAAKLATSAIAAAEHHHSHAAKAMAMHGTANVSLDEFVARQMNRAVMDENAQLEQGLTILASVGSVAPFVGLFGTVWGIYHALASISQSGQATLDKVAGPVGEALIMTALGLAVAIPAVLAYNALVRANRNYLYQLEHFGAQLHTLLITGAMLHVPDDTAKKDSTAAILATSKNTQVPA